MNVITSSFDGLERRSVLSSRQPLSYGFTLAELLVVVAIIAILSALLLPALATQKSKTQSISCQNNLRQLQIAWQMYTLDHGDTLPANQWMNLSWIDGCPNGYLCTADSWVLGDSTIDTECWNIRNGSLFPFTRNTDIYRCPGDRTTVHRTFGDSTPPMLRTRSYSMSYYMNGSEQKPERKTRFSQIKSPSRVFVFLDEHETSINDGVFFVHVPNDDGERTEGMHWMDLPADRHRQGCNLSFADAHVEHWKWRWHKTWNPATVADHEVDAWNEDDRQDLRRLQTGIPEL
jgi:prepilin-type N-terminal cleavage/methylation domain-containing protein/prepilin-type processing-associated H-X9-DG protein